MNPWVYYAIDVVNSLRTLQVFLVPACIICCIFCVTDIMDGNSRDKNVQKIIKWAIVIFIISLLILLFVPSNEAMVRMVIAQYGTEGQEVEDAVKKIMHIWGPFIR